MANKNVQRKCSAEAAILDGCALLSELNDEMSEWVSNMETNFSSAQRFQTGSDTADALSNLNLEPEIPEGLPEGLEVSYHEEVAYKGKSLSRASRLGNAVSLLSAGVGGIEDHIAGLESRQNSLVAQAKEVRRDAEAEITELAGDEGDSLPEKDADERRDEAANAAEELLNEADALGETVQELEDFCSEVQNIIDEAEGLEFPGMYG